jgi:hypothetical protein
MRRRHLRWLTGLLFLLSACNHPNITLLEQPRAAVMAEQVNVLTEFPPEGSYSKLAQVYAWSSVPVDSRVGYDRAVAKLRMEAATIGADAIVVPDSSQIRNAAVQSRWMWPVGGTGGRDGNFEDVRPTELMGWALVRQ